jgi:hypothetical protein
MAMLLDASLTILDSFMDGRVGIGGIATIGHFLDVVGVHV